MTTRILCAAALSLAAVTYPAASLAQTGDLDAIATITKLEAPLETQIVENVDFGEVNKPNGARPGAKCRYQIGASAARNGESRAEELDLSGQVVDAALPTPSMCGWGTGDEPDSFPTGVVAVYCEAGLDVQMDASFTPAGVAGVGFSRPSGLKSLGYFDPDAQTLINDTFGTSLTTTCREFSDTAGALGVLVGAQIILDESAAETVNNIAVGTITLEFSY